VCVCVCVCVCAETWSRDEQTAQIATPTRAHCLRPGARWEEGHSKDGTDDFADTAPSHPAVSEQSSTTTNDNMEAGLHSVQAGAAAPSNHQTQQRDNSAQLRASNSTTQKVDSAHNTATVMWSNHHPPTTHPPTNHPTNNVPPSLPSFTTPTRKNA